MALCPSLASKRTPRPSHIGSRHVKEINIDAVLVHREIGQQVRNGSLNRTIRFLGNGANRIQTTQGGGSITASKNDISLVSDRDRCTGRVRIARRLQKKLVALKSISTRTNVRFGLARRLANGCGTGFVNHRM